MEITDSTGDNQLFVGSKVRFRGQNYTIKSFGPKTDKYVACDIFFEEDQHTPEVATEMSVDLVQ